MDENFEGKKFTPVDSRLASSSCLIMERLGGSKELFNSEGKFGRSESLSSGCSAAAKEAGASRQAY